MLSCGHGVCESPQSIIMQPHAKYQPPLIAPAPTIADVAFQDRGQRYIHHDAQVCLQHGTHTQPCPQCLYSSLHHAIHANQYGIATACHTTVNHHMLVDPPWQPVIPIMAVKHTIVEDRPGAHHSVGMGHHQQPHMSSHSTVATTSGTQCRYRQTPCQSIAHPSPQWACNPVRKPI